MGLKARLESLGIPCVLKNETPGSFLGGTDPSLGSRHPEIWVVDDHQFEHALEIIHSRDTADPAPECETEDE